MPQDYNFIFTTFHRAYVARAGGDITGQQELVATLPRVTKANEFSFENEGHLLHRCPIEDHKRKAMYEFDWKTSARTPMVAFLNLSLSARHIIEEIQYIRRGFPFAIFVLYGDDSEYLEFFSELADEDAAWFRRFYTLRKDSSEGFSVAVRTVLDKAMATAVNKVEKSKLFSAFISYSHKDKNFAEWLHDQIRRAGIRCWLDEKQIRAGDRIHAKIEEAIYDRDKILLCASKHSNSPVDAPCDLSHSLIILFIFLLPPAIIFNQRVDEQSSDVTELVQR